LLEFVEEKVALAADAVHTGSDFGIVPDPVGGDRFQSVSNECGIWGVHRIIRSIEGTGLGFTSGLVLVQKDIPWVFRSRNVADDGCDK
jgi:hypothetical protein